MKNTTRLSKNISKYILKSTPKGLPKVSRFMENYVQALFGSGAIQDTFALLDSYYGDGFKFGDNIVQENCSHFILEDFCSSVGVTYKPEYREPILRSFVGKTLSYFKWLFSDFMRFPVVDIVLQRNGSDLDFSLTDKGEITDLQPQSSFTDSFTRAFVVMNISLDSSFSEIDLFDRLDSYKDLLLLVLPARVFLDFFFREELIRFLF